MPDLSGCFFSSQVVAGKQHLFTDGSCTFQAQPDFALSAWGVVHANTGQALSSGHVPGVLQSAPRAELWALISALKWGLRVRVELVIWTDSLNCATGVRALLSGCDWLPGENCDLWEQIAEQLSGFSWDELDIQHVPSHVLSNLCESPLEEWLANWNRHADELAGRTNLNRPLSLVELHRDALAHHDYVCEVLRALRTVYFAIAEQTGAARATQEAIDDLEDVVLNELQACTQGERLHEALPLNWSRCALTSCSELPSYFVQSLCDFLFRVDSSSQGVVQVSWLELLVMLLHEGSVVFPVQDVISGSWVVPSNDSLRPPLTFAVQLRVARGVWKRCLGPRLLEEFGVTGLSLVDCGISFPVDGLRIGCDGVLLRQARGSISRFVGSRLFRTVGQLARPFHF